MFGLMTKAKHNAEMFDRNMRDQDLIERLRLEAQGERSHLVQQIEGLQGDVRQAEKAAERAEKRYRRLVAAVTGGDPFLDPMRAAEVHRDQKAKHEAEQKALRDELEAYKIAEREAVQKATKAAAAQAQRERDEAEEAERQADPYRSDRPRTVQLRDVQNTGILLHRNGVTSLVIGPDDVVVLRGPHGADRFKLTDDVRLSVEWEDVE